MEKEQPVIFARGEISKKLIGDTYNRKEEMAQPIAYFDGNSMGVGLSYTEEDNALFTKGTFWGLICPRKVITSYRAMKIAEHVPEFINDTLAKCYFAAQRDPHSYEQKGADKITKIIGKNSTKEILEMVPDNFDNILKLLQDNNVEHIFGHEIKEEVDSGRLEATPAVQEFLDQYQKHI